MSAAGIGITPEGPRCAVPHEHREDNSQRVLAADDAEKVPHG